MNGMLLVMFGASAISFIMMYAVSDIIWGNLILVWGALMLAGVLVAVPIRKK